MTGLKTLRTTITVAVVIAISGISIHSFSQQQAAVAQNSSNTTNPVNPISSAPTPFSIDTIQYNLPYGDWTARWWQWVLSIPEDRNPVADQTGENCDEGQSGPVWFLAGTFGGLNERVCTIPAGKAILFPTMNALCTFIERPNLRTESELRSCAISLNEGVTELMVTVDGQLISEQQLRSYRVQSPLFDIALPNGNIVTGQEGSTQGVSDGFWFFLPPLMPGEHDIHFRGSIVDYTTASQNNFVTESLYHITIAE